jgi:two-component system, chemotaxis family, sensor kinase Cph1
LSATTLNLFRLLDDLEIQLHPIVDDRRLRLIFERGPEVPQYIRTDEFKLRQVLTNLLGVVLESTSQGSVLLRTDNAVCSHQTSQESEQLLLGMVTARTADNQGAFENNLPGRS